MEDSKVEKTIFFSQSLLKEKSLQVYLPIISNDSALPVLYFLHGRSGNENIMFDLNISEIATRLINNGLICPLIIVCPSIDNSRGVNSSVRSRDVQEPGNPKRILNLGMYEDYFINEIIPLIDKKYNTIKRPPESLFWRERSLTS